MGETVAAIGKVSLEPFDTGRDTDRLRRWLQTGHVARWWGNADRALKDALRPITGGGDALIIADTVPVGYLRWETVSREELEAAGLNEIPDGTVDIDIAIGEPDYTGRGIAARALKLLVERLLENESIPMIMICTSTENTPAIRAYEKAGFRRVRTFQDPEYGEMWLFMTGSLHVEPAKKTKTSREDNNT